MERCDARPLTGTVGAVELVPQPNPLHKLGNLLHLSHMRPTGFVTALSLEGAVTRPAALASIPSPASALWPVSAFFT